MGWGNESLFQCPGHMTKMATMSIYGKTLKTFSGTKKRWVLEYYQVCSNDDPGLTLTYFRARSTLVPYAFVWKQGKTMDVLDTIAVYDIKVGRCS